MSFACFDFSNYFSTHSQKFSESVNLEATAFVWILSIFTYNQMLGFVYKYHMNRMTDIFSHSEMPEAGLLTLA